MAIATAFAIATGLSKFIPLVKDLFDDGDESIVEKVVGIAENLTGKSGNDVIAAIESDPNLALEFKKAVMADKHVESRLEIKRLMIINKTMQVESQSAKWWVSGWRPFIGFITGIAFAIVCIQIGMITFDAIDKNNKDALNMIPTLIFNYTTLFGIPGAILGIASHHRGMLQRLNK
jgi:hypothetical protein